MTTLTAQTAAATVVLFMGDANMNGARFMDWGAYDWSQSSRVQIWIPTSDGNGYFTNYEPGFNSATTMFTAGPELEFVTNWLRDNPTGTLYIGKYAPGNVAIHADYDNFDFSPFSRGEAFDVARDMAGDMLRYLGETQLDGVFLMLGSADTQDEFAGKHADLFTNFLSEVRGQIMHDANGYIGYARIGDTIGADDYNQMVRVAQWQVDQNDANAESFRTIGMEFESDGATMTMSGLHSVGQSFYDNWIG
jgi:hypothetical protein